MMQEASIPSWASEGHVQAVFNAKSSNSFQIEVDVDKLDQGLTNIFCKGPDSKYFRLCRP